MKKEGLQKIGLERIYRLFELAENECESRPERAREYVSLALEISKRSRARMPDELKTRFCKKCHASLKGGVNSEITAEKEMKTVKCLACGFERKTGRKNGNPSNTSGRSQ